MVDSLIEENIRQQEELQRLREFILAVADRVAPRAGVIRPLSMETAMQDINKNAYLYFRTVRENKELKTKNTELLTLIKELLIAKFNWLKP